MSILTEEKVKNLKTDYNTNLYSKKELSIKHEIKYSNVVAILNGRSWTHVK